MTAGLSDSDQAGNQASSAATGSPFPPILNGRPLGAKRSSSNGKPAAAAIVLLKSDTET